MYCCLEVDLIIMKLYTALIIASIAPVSGAFDVAAAIPAFVETSTEQIVCDEQVRSTQPYYCFGSEYQNCDCWQEICGLCLPQCCFKNKGNCPRNMDNAQCNTSPEPMPSPPTPPPNNRRPGSNYCTYSPPDYACYPNTSGKPGCCWDDDGEYCPPQKPGCHQQQQPVVGSDYCTYGFDYECYPGTGKPACCLQDGGRNCPNQQPPCQQQQRLGSNYCTFGFDYSCIPSLANLNAAFRMVVNFALLNVKRVHPRQCRQTNNPLLKVKERPTLLHFARLRQVLLDKTYAHGLQTMHVFLTLMGGPHAARAPKAVTLGQARNVNHAARRT
ncbi:hypothetical protein QTG54_003737 [Skeletonema marinoi]|uniref:Uncharacterized protein n=1 Tax=Skeletonema marinoi TaxID=267567 RepID=A0AAD9DHJ3_9STRA|nr:hypothetical protein QTG54_003737 [Skeletonema marinoi]